MYRTLYEFIIQIQELIFLPLERGTGMWAAIVISEKFAIFMDHENRLRFALYFELKTFTAGVFDISGFAENVCHNVC